MGLLDWWRLRNFKPTPIGEILDPTIDTLRRMKTDDLVKYKASRPQGDERWLHADAILRQREAWSGPVKLSLGFSAVALVLSALALLLS